MASTSAGTTPHELHSLNLLHAYLDTLDSIPRELSRHFNELREADANLSNSADQITTRLNRLSASLEEDSLSPKERFLALRDASDTIKQFKLNQEEKIKIGTATCETMLAHTGLFPPAPLFPPSGTNLQRLFARAMLSLSPNAINGRRRALQPPRPAIYNGESRKRPLSTSMNQQGSTKAQARRVPTISGAGPRTAINQRRNESTITNSPNPSEIYANKATTVRQIEKSSQQRRPNGGQPLYSPPPSPYQYSQIPQPIYQQNYIQQPFQQQQYNTSRMAESTNANELAQEPSYEDMDNGQAGGENDGDEARYCYCNGVSYGQMIGCDDEQCQREWFHIACVGLDKAPSVTPRYSRQSSYSTSMAGENNDTNDLEDGRASRTPNKQSQARRKQSKSTLRHHSVHHQDEDNSSEELRQPSDADEDIPAHELTLKERQNAINIEHPFGLPIWKPALYKKSRSATEAANNALHSEPTSHPSSFTMANIAWFLLAGWWLSLLCYLASGFLFLFEWTKKDSLWVTLLYDLAWYISWPFGGKYVEGAGRDPQSHHEDGEINNNEQSTSQNDEYSALLQRSQRETSYGAVLENINQHKPSPKRSKIAERAYYTLLIGLLAPPLCLVSLLSFFAVIPIPMGKLLYELIGYLYASPKQTRFRPAPRVLVPTPSNDNDENDGSLPANQFTVPKLKAGQSLPPTKHGETSTVLLCVYNAGGTRYYKFTVGGVNIFFVNLLPLVFLVILDAFLLQPYVEKKGITSGPLALITSRALLFVLSLSSVIPLSYFIGMAVASISAQSSIGVGSVINATFGSLIEILIYSFALMDSKSSLVEGSLVGSVLAGVLLMPGASMCAGALRKKELRFNAKAAGVTSTMLIMAIIGTLTPTLFYQTYGITQLHVDPHTDSFYQENVKHLMYFCAAVLVLSYLVGLWFSLRTHASQIWQNPQQLMHQMEGVQNAQPNPAALQPKHRASFFKKGGLPVTNDPTTPKKQAPVRPATATLQKQQPPIQTQASSNSVQMRGSQPTLVQVPPSMAGEDFSRAIVAENPTDRPPSLTQSVPEGSIGGAPPSTQTGHDSGHGQGEGGHEAPEWSRTTSSTVLLACTILYAAIAEILVNEVDVVLEGSSIPEKFLGISLFALVPNTTEFMNAMSFALNGNIALSMEISSAYALQVCLLQIPAMVLFSALTSDANTPPQNVFVLIFPRWDAIAIIFAVFLLTYMLTESRSNYYRGTILILSYLVLTAGFYYAPVRTRDDSDSLLTGMATDGVLCNDSTLHLYQKVWFSFQSMFLM
ncbi:hypothetical protein E3P91_02391 [Wallemia ichthyophaga]|nr:hypothetical protein E3P91_02391 [Wallemia ichthyophaga]TIB62923.1 hypothetical protein E3P78_02149 [Wallemia ichthyophaga]